MCSGVYYGYVNCETLMKGNDIIGNAAKHSSRNCRRHIFLNKKKSIKRHIFMNGRDTIEINGKNCVLGTVSISKTILFLGPEGSTCVLCFSSNKATTSPFQNGKLQ